MKEQRNYYDSNKILPNNELKYYIETFLINDDDFINDVDLCLCDDKIKNMTIDERKEYFNFNIGNEAKTYIFKILTLKYLCRLLIDSSDYFLDIYWQNRLKKIFLFNKVNQDKELNETIKKICKLEIISISTIQNYFKLSFSKASAIIDNLVNNKIIKRCEQKNIGYIVIRKRRFYMSLKKQLSSYF